jgi:hypothetical protein
VVGVVSGLIASPVHTSGAAAGFTAKPEPAVPGVFISGESLTFPSAAAVCAALVSGLKLFFGDADNVWWVLSVCVFVSIIIVLLGWPTKKDPADPDPSPKRTIAVYIAIGALNTFLLFVSVMGIISVSTSKVPGL